MTFRLIDRQGIHKAQLVQALTEGMDSIAGDARKMLLVPPDITRLHSGAGMVAQYLWYHGKARVSAVLPALGTHGVMTETEYRTMFGDMPLSLLRNHNWRRDLVHIGTIDSSVVNELSEGLLQTSLPIWINRLLTDGTYDRIISIGQVAPHEVVGMSNHVKNLLVGTGGKEIIEQTHWLSAVYGMEKIMGHTDTPVRCLLNTAWNSYARSIPVVYVLMVLKQPSFQYARHTDDDSLDICGLFMGDDIQCFIEAAALSAEMNIYSLPAPLETAVVMLEENQYHSTWIGNKAIYRLRLAMADGGKLFILAPGLRRFGEDTVHDALIRRFGYRPREEIMAMVDTHEELANELTAAAHLVHGSVNQRFEIIYCTQHMSKEVMQSVGYNHEPFQKTAVRYNPRTLQEGMNTVGGKDVFFVSNPARGLWRSV